MSVWVDIVLVMTKWEKLEYETVLLLKQQCQYDDEYRADQEVTLKGYRQRLVGVVDDDGDGGSAEVGEAGDSNI